MANKILIKNSSTTGNEPSALDPGELAINSADRTIFYKVGSLIRRFVMIDKFFTAAVGFPAVRIKTINVVDSQVELTSKINVSWDDVLDTDQNDPEFSDIGFKVRPNNGSFDLTIFSQGKDAFGGDFKLKYSIK